MTQIYDIGIHYIPDDEGKVSAYMEEVKRLIEEGGGTVLNVEEPEQMDLSYEVYGKRINMGGVYTRYQQSFFFNIRCKCSNIQTINTTLEKNADIIRHIVVKTEQDTSFVDPALYTKKEEETKKKKQTQDPASDEAEAVKVSLPDDGVEDEEAFTYVDKVSKEEVVPVPDEKK